MRFRMTETEPAALPELSPDPNPTEDQQIDPRLTLLQTQTLNLLSNKNSPAEPPDQTPHGGGAPPQPSPRFPERQPE